MVASAPHMSIAVGVAPSPIRPVHGAAMRAFWQCEDSRMPRTGRGPVTATPGPLLPTTTATGRGPDRGAALRPPEHGALPISPTRAARSRRAIGASACARRPRRVGLLVTERTLMRYLHQPPLVNCGRTRRGMNA